MINTCINSTFLAIIDQIHKKLVVYKAPPFSLWAGTMVSEVCDSVKLCWDLDSL